MPRRATEARFDKPAATRATYPEPVTRPLRVGSLLVLAAVMPALAGCGAIAERSARKELVVIFTVHVTPSEVQRVRQACQDMPGVVQEPPATNKTASTRLYPLRYTVTNANSQQFAALASCVTSDPAVRSYTISGGVDS